MSDVESASTVFVADNIATVGETKKRPSVKKPSAESPANSGKRWSSIELEMLWAHRHFSHERDWYRQCDCERCEELRRTGGMPEEGPEVHYKQFAKLVQRSDQACRLIIHHIKKDVWTGAISLKDALAGKTLPSQQALARRKQAAAAKKARSSKDVCADEPLSDRTSKPGRQAFAENTALSPKDAVSEKPLSYQACKSQKHAPAEGRAVSPEDALAKKPRHVKAYKVRKQATAGTKAVSPKHASVKKLTSRPAFEPRSLPTLESISQFRSREGERVDLPPAEPPVEPPTEKDLEAATTLLEMMTQEQVPDHSTTPRHDSFMAGSSFGRLQMPDRSISSSERFLEHYVGERA